MLPWRRQTISENRASQQIDQGLLTFAMSLSLNVCLCLFVSIRLGHCHHQVISFQKIYGLYGLKHHTMEINGDVTMERTNDKQTESENRASQPFDKGLLDC